MFALFLTADVCPAGTASKGKLRAHAMSGLGIFQPSTLGMTSQSHRLNTIGYNIANVNSGGFKRTDTGFHTLISDNVFQQSDNGGVKPYSIATNDIQGLVQPTNRNLDLAIIGQGFFAVQPTLTGTSDIYYTRDGSFEINTVDGQTSSVTADDGSTITVNNGYLVDKNGYFVLGVPINADGTFSTSGAAPMRVDQYAFLDQAQATTDAMMYFNLPANANFGDEAETYTLRTYDSAGNERNISFDFSKTLTDNQWRIDFSADNLTSGTLSPGSTFSYATGGATGYELQFDAVNSTIQVVNSTTGLPVAGAFSGLKAGDDITLANTLNNNSTFTISGVQDGGSTLKVTAGSVTAEANTGATAIDITSTASLTDRLIFNSTGELQSPTELTFDATWDDGSTSSFTIDIANFTQFNGAFTPYQTGQNGYGAADLTDVGFDSAGQVVGTFSDGTQRVIYKIPLYDFTNPDGLKSSNGMLFQETEQSGSPTAFFADESSKASFMPAAVETSNVDIALEFTRMIQTQTAYNMSSTTFKTIDEMLTVARDLKT